MIKESIIMTARVLFKEMTLSQYTVVTIAKLTFHTLKGRLCRLLWIQLVGINKLNYSIGLT